MKKILVVDDDVHGRSVLCDILESEGFVALPAMDGKEALRLLETEPVGLIMTDRSMPGMDGLALLKTLQERHSKVPVVMMSAFGEEKLWGEAIGFGAREYILKPFNPVDVINLVRKLLKED